MKTRHNACRVNFVAGSKKRKKLVLRLLQRLLCQIDSFSHCMLMPLTDATLVTTLTKTDFRAGDMEALRLQRLSNRPAEFFHFMLRDSHSEDFYHSDRFSATLDLSTFFLLPLLNMAAGLLNSLTALALPAAVAFSFLPSA